MRAIYSCFDNFQFLDNVKLKIIPDYPLSWGSGTVAGDSTMSIQGQNQTEVLNQAKDCYANADYQSAITHFRLLLNYPDFEDEGLKGLGFSLQALGRHTEAANTLQTGINKFPNDMDFKFGHALALQSMGNLPLAIREFEHVLAVIPNHAAAQHHLDAAKRALQPAPQAQAPAPAAPQTAIPTMLPCPKCRQPMPGRSRLCPHCGSMVDPIGGVIMSGRAEQMGLSREEKVYKVVSWIRIAFGALWIVVGLLMPVPFIGVFLSIVGSWFLLTGIGLLLEIGWVQFIVYWGSLLAALSSCASIFNALTTGAYIGLPFDLIAITIHGATMWSISKLSDFGGS